MAINKLISVGDKFKSKRFGYIIVVSKLDVGYVYFKAVNEETEAKATKSNFLQTFDKYIGLHN